MNKNKNRIKRKKLKNNQLIIISCNYQQFISPSYELESTITPANYTLLLVDNYLGSQTCQIVHL